MTILTTLKRILPWRIYRTLEEWVEHELRSTYPSIYKIIKFGRKNINTPTYWNTVWQNDKIQRHYTELFNIITNRIPENAKVLDVGCGVGRLSRIIKNECAAEVVGLDFSSWACEQLAKEGFETIVSSLPKIPVEDNTFDIAVATEVLEHLDKPELTIFQMARVVKPGGMIMCSVPNNSLHPHEEFEHQQSFTESKIIDMVSSFGSDIEIKTGRMQKDSSVEFLFLKAIINK